jgi:hypothetical protein
MNNTELCGLTSNTLSNALTIAICALIAFSVSACGSSSPPSATPSATAVSSDDGFSAFIKTFAQELHPSQFQATDALFGTIDQYNFKTYFECYDSSFNTIGSCSPSGLEDILSSGQLYLSVNTPLVSTCSNSSIYVHEVRSVMGQAQYNPSQPAIDLYEGYVRFTFIEPIPGSSWEWEELDKATGQCH